MPTGKSKSSSGAPLDGWRLKKAKNGRKHRKHSKNRWYTTGPGPMTLIGFIQKKQADHPWASEN